VNRIAIRWLSIPIVLFVLAVSCQATPPTVSDRSVQAYQAAVNQLVGPMWMKLVKRNGAIVSVGTVRARFEIAPDGHVQHVRIVSNTGNRIIAVVVVQTVQSARLPHMPRSVILQLPKGYMEADMTFTLRP
jgi:hypothetical protein